MLRIANILCLTLHIKVHKSGGGKGQDMFIYEQWIAGLLGGGGLEEGWGTMDWEMDLPGFWNEKLDWVQLEM